MSQPPSSEYIAWLEERSLLSAAASLSRAVSGQGRQWRRAYTLPQTEEVIKTAGVWFTSYPGGTITGDGESILQSLGNEQLWALFREIGITGLHTGPMKHSGAVVPGQKAFTETCDGWFDRISLDIDPAFGSDADYAKLTSTAKANGAIVLGDIIPGHTGKGTDFLLATYGYKNYPGLYTMVSIEPHHWSLLPEVAQGKDSANLSFETNDKLTELGYLPGRPQRVLFSVPGEPPKTAYDATPVVVGVDGVARRWVYLHYFKPGQPTLNWLDPTFAANQIEAADIIRSLNEGCRMLRLDANPFLGIEKKPDGINTHSEGTPLAVQSSNSISWLIRKLGGWSFQELNLGLDEIAGFSAMGADISYDFICRPAVQHALLLGDASLLMLMQREMAKYKVDPRTLIHAMQNHDEITYELVHFLTHANDEFEFKGQRVTGEHLRNRITQEMHSKAMGAKTPYNGLSGNGLCTTFTGLAASALGISDPWHMSDSDKARVTRGHLLLAFYNLFQPGVFAVSAWDLLGALPMPKAEVAIYTDVDGDWRWINRGAFDLLGLNLKASKSALGIPRAHTLYQTLPEQLKDTKSFLSQLKQMIAIRVRSGIAVGTGVSLPQPDKDALSAALYRLQNGHLLLVIINWGIVPISGSIKVPEIAVQRGTDVVSGASLGDISSGEFKYSLDFWEGRAIEFRH